MRFCLSIFMAIAFLCQSTLAYSASKDSSAVVYLRSDDFYSLNEVYHRIETAQAEVICLTNIPNESVCLGLYNTLKPQYDNVYVDMNPDYSGLLIASKRNLDAKTLCALALNSLSNNFYYLQIGHAEVSVSKDTEGNSSIEANASASTQTEGGTKFSAEISGGVTKDFQGSTNANVTGTISIDWYQQQ